MDEQVKYGKIKVYGKVIDLDNTPIEDLKRMKKALDNRLRFLSEKYVETYSNDGIDE